LEWLEGLGGSSTNRNMDREKGMEEDKERLPRGYEWKLQEAKRKNKKGRAIGEMILGI